MKYAIQVLQKVHGSSKYIEYMIIEPEWEDKDYTLEQITAFKHGYKEATLLSDVVTYKVNIILVEGGE